MCKILHQSRRTGFNAQRLTIDLAMLGVIIPISCMISIAQHKTGDSRNENTVIEDRAKTFIQAGRANDALTLLNRADLRGPNAGDIHTLKGICFAILSKPIESVEEFDLAIALRPNYAPTYLSSGLAAANFNNLDRAVEELSTAIRLEPELPGARYNYALVLARAGRYAESEKQIDLEMAASQRMESELDLWTMKARDAYYLEEWQHAIDAYRKTLKLRPKWAEAYAAIGKALYSLNRLKESKLSIIEALKLDPDDGAAHETLARIYQDEGQETTSIEEFETAIRLRYNDREALYHLLRIYTKRGDSLNAARVEGQMRDLAKSDMTDSLSEAKAAEMNRLGIELENRGEFAGALTNFDQAARADVANIIFQRNAALLLCKIGRVQEAIRRLRDILSLDADDPETLQILAVADELAAGEVSQESSLPAPQLSN